MKASNDKNPYKGRGNVDVGSWIGVVSLALALPVGVASILITPRLVAYLEKRKLIKSHRSKEQDLAAYRNIEAFKNGTRDKYATYIAMAVLSVIFAIGSATCVLLVALKGELIEGTILPSQPTVFLSLSAFGLFLVSFLSIFLIINAARRIERFDEYTAEIRKKWGDDAV
jgi:hypothetical protein